jgi:2-iminobutanoate/2-iminopropanoate deaminase
MPIEPISTEKAPKAIGPYSQAIRAGQFIFLSGQIPIDSKTNQLLAGTIEEQTVLVLKNARQVLKAAGASLANVVKTTIFLSDLEDFSKVNAVYARYFPSNPPARSTVQAARLPRNVGIEIEMIAFLG